MGHKSLELHAVEQEARITELEASIKTQPESQRGIPTVEEKARMRQLNERYRETFGFPFLFAVKGSTSQQVLAALEDRLPRGREDELAEALQQVYRIARFRLDDLIIR